MKLLLVVACLIACCISGMAGAWPPVKVGVEAEVQDAAVYQILKEHKPQKADIHQYIFNDVDSIVDRIEIPKKPKGEERYAKNN